MQEITSLKDQANYCNPTFPIFSENLVRLNRVTRGPRLIWAQKSNVIQSKMMQIDAEANERTEHPQMLLGFNESKSMGQRGNPSYLPGFSLAPTCFVVLKPIDLNVSSADTAEGNVGMVAHAGS